MYMYIYLYDLKAMHKNIILYLGSHLLMYIYIYEADSISINLQEQTLLENFD